MLAWMQSWSRATWAMAWAGVVGTVVVAVVLFGPEVVRGWVEALWTRQ